MSASTTNGAHSGERLHIIVCGGGIAGFATAALLREDHDVTVLEQSSLNKELGAAITLSMNASRLLRTSLERAGFDAVKARCVEAETFQELHWKDFSVLLEWKMEMVTRKYNQPWWYFSRHDVHAELKRAAVAEEGLGRPAKVVTSSQVLEVDPEKATVTLASGEVIQGDVVVGADGINTNTGKSVFGKLDTVYSGFSAYRCMIESEDLRNDPVTAPLVDSAKVLMLIGPDRRIVAYPCSSWKWINLVCIFPDDEKRQLQWTTKASVAEMIEKFHDFNPAVSKMLSMAKETGVWQLKDRNPLSTLVKEKYVMIGDAAHAMGPHQGQGGCQAIEDGEALRVVLKGATKADIVDRLKVFDKLRVERVKTVIEYTRIMGPKRVETKNDDKELDHKSTQTFSDYYWSYHLTQEAVKVMNEAGYKMEVVDDKTGELKI